MREDQIGAAGQRVGEVAQRLAAFGAVEDQGAFRRPGPQREIEPLLRLREAPLAHQRAADLVVSLPAADLIVHDEVLEGRLCAELDRCAQGYPRVVVSAQATQRAAALKVGIGEGRDDREALVSDA